MVGYIKNKGWISELENLRATEQGYMLYLQIEFIKESEKHMPSLDILSNTGKNYLMCMGHIIDTAETEYGVISSKENTTTIRIKLNRLQEYIDAARKKIVLNNTDPRVLTNRSVKPQYDPELIRNELHEIYDIMWVAFKGYEAASVPRVEWAVGRRTSIDNRYASMYHTFILLYVLGASLVTLDGIITIKRRRVALDRGDCREGETVG